jgi:transposase
MCYNLNNSTCLNLERFYPEDIEITGIIEMEKEINIIIKSTTHEQICPVCGAISHTYHSTYKRKIHDLPILGKSVYLNVTAYRYYCDNQECTQKIFCEELDGFTGRYRRMTLRLEDFVVTLALNTSCEGTSRICKQMGINVSGDTIIKILLRNIESVDNTCSEIIGVDDWAYKKGQTYGTIICDGKTHKPVELLDGRDGSMLKEWLLNNKHIKVVTRDRASAYAKVISEVLPNAMQIADRFHLHQNLLKAIKDALIREIPNKISLSEEAIDSQAEEAFQIFETKKKRID